MFVQSLDRIRCTGRLSAALAMVVSLLALVALSAPAGASAAPGIVPAGAEQGKGIAESAQSTAGEKHGMGALLPTTQVDAKASLARSGEAAQLLPTSIDLSGYSVPVGNQGQVGSCVTWTVDYAMLGWYSKRDNRSVQSFNPMYTYSQIRNTSAIEPNGGSYPKDALNVALTQGNDSMAHYSHTTTDYASLPNASERANAANYKIAGWDPLFAYPSGAGNGTISAEMIKTALANGKPVAISLTVRPGFNNMAHTSTTLDTDTSGIPTGRHEILAVAYDQYGVWIQNSWGTGWGYNGYGRLSWEVVGKDVYQADTIRGLAATTTTDTTAPTMGTVDQQFQLGGLITATTAPTRFSWLASDNVGVSAYEIWVKTDTGSYVRDTTVAANATSVSYALLIGHTYQVAVKARDAAGNWSSYAYSVTVTPSVTDDKAFSTTSTWGRYNLTDSYGGTYMASSQAGSSFTYTATGRDLALIGPRFSTAGRATLYCDGTSYGLVDAYGATTVGRQVLTWCHFSGSGQHTLKIVLEGTSGRPWFGVDAFAALS